MSRSVADLRREYARARFDEKDASHDPIVEFSRWFARRGKLNSRSPTP